MKRLGEDLRRWKGSILAASVSVILMTALFGGVCLSKLVFGIPCPGCGLTRAGLLFLRGDFKASFQMHPMFVVLIPGIMIFLFERYGKGKKAPVSSAYFILYLLALFLVFLVRMRTDFPNQEPLTFYEGALFSLNFFE